MGDFRKYIDFTKIAEGGLSKAKTDTASKYPVPDGSGYHTNKGITWTTFKRYAPTLKYVATPKLFYEMPEWIFLGIFQGYWKSAGAHLTNSQAMSNIIFQSMWGGGHSNLVKDIQRYLMAKKYPGIKDDGKLGNNTANAINKETATIKGEADIYNYTHQERLNYLRSLSSYKDNKGGWESRMKDLYDMATTLIGQAVKKKASSNWYNSNFLRWFNLVNNKK